MKYFISIFSILCIAACGITAESTLFDMWNWCFWSKPDVKEVEIDEKYILAKRGDRYENASYNIDPQVYAIVAGRVTSNMLIDAPAIFAKDKKAPLYIAETTQIDRYLPSGPDAAGKAAKEIIFGSRMFNIVEEKDAASFVLESTLNNIGTPEVPVIMYEMRIVDSKGAEHGKWSDTIRQIQNDDGSWW